MLNAHGIRLHDGSDTADRFDMPKYAYKISPPICKDWHTGTGIRA